jgi:hypothetical protein
MACLAENSIAWLLVALTHRPVPRGLSLTAPPSMSCGGHSANLQTHDHCGAQSSHPSSDCASMHLLVWKPVNPLEASRLARVAADKSGTHHEPKESCQSFAAVEETVKRTGAG